MEFEMGSGSVPAGHYTVEFVGADLRKLPQPGNHFDIIYCLSVLEHTRGYPEILLELRRVLRPGGTLVVTFDLSLDGDSDIEWVVSRTSAGNREPGALAWNEDY